MTQADLELLLAQSDQVHWLLDIASSRLLYVSPAAARRLGCSGADALARAQELAVPLLDGLPERLARLAQGDESRRTVVREAELAGVPVEIVSTVADGKLAGVVRDVSGRRAVEQQQKQFASMLSHEFRSPLATIDGAVQRLVASGSGADEATRKRYQKIQSACDRLLAMLDDYLSPDRLAAIGKRKQDNAIVPARLLEQAAAAARARRPAIALRLGELPASLRGDPPGMRLCLDVLLDNAIKYSPPDSTVELGGSTAAEGGVEFVVIDRGAAIPADELPRLFDKGFRGAAATGVPGSGLGLYMAKAVVEVHGGMLSVQNLPESGKKFRIWLPAVRSALHQRVTPLIIL
jgi:signal transduction histidine kinase